MSKLHISTSPLTNRILIGRVDKSGLAFSGEPQDITGAACGAVCEHVRAAGKPVIVTCNGKPKFEITVKDLEPQDL